jgi:hypothetical protein
MNNVQGIDNGIEYDARAAENARALAYRTSNALFLAVDRKGLLLTLPINLTLASS